MTTNFDQRVFDEFETVPEATTPERVANQKKIMEMYSKMVAGEVVKTDGPTRECVYAGK